MPSKGTITEVFTAHLDNLSVYAAADEQAATNQEAGSFYKPPEAEGWSGDLFDHVGMAKAFDRTELFEMFRKVVGADPGTLADLQLTALQGDTIAALERAYRARHRTSPRAHTHAAARRMGHSHPAGVLSKGIVGYLQNLDRLGKS